MNKIKLYSVIKYFDDHYEKTIKKGMSLEEAKKLKYSFTAGEYTSYEVKQEFQN